MKVTLDLNTLLAQGEITQAEFDKFADEYRAMLADTIRASGESPEYFSRYKIRHTADWCARHTCLVRGRPSSAPSTGREPPTRFVEVADTNRQKRRGRTLERARPRRDDRVAQALRRRREARAARARPRPNGAASVPLPPFELTAQPPPASFALFFPFLPASESAEPAPTVTSGAAWGVGSGW